MTAPAHQELRRLLRSVERPVVVPLWMIGGLTALLLLSSCVGGLLLGNAQ